MAESCQSLRPRVPGEAYAALAAVLFGTAYVATGVALDDFSPASIGAWRGLFSAALFAILIRASRFFRIPVRDVRPGGWLRLLLIASLGGPAFLLGMNYAVAWSGAATSAFVAGLYAVIAAALAPVFLAERLDRRTIAGLLAGLIGAALLAQSPADRPEAGVAAALGAALSFACYLVLSRRWAHRYGLSPGLIAGGNLTLSGVVLLLVTLMTQAGPLVPDRMSPGAIGAIAWLGTSSVVAQIALMIAVRRVIQRSTSAMLLLNPPTAALLAWTLLAEPFPPLKIAASLLILLGMVVVVAGRRPTPSIPESHPR